MRRPNNAKLRSRSAQLSSSDAPTSQVPRKSPRWNATKHGLRSKSTLQPGDDAAEFQERRRDAYETYRPRTIGEKRCVDAMVRLQWKMDRWDRWQDVYDDKHEAVLGEGPDGQGGPHCEADPHHWMHRSMDCSLQTQRLERRMTRARWWLEELQHKRRQNLLNRMAALEAEQADFGVEEDVPLPDDPETEDRSADGAPDDDPPVEAAPRAANGGNGHRLIDSARASSGSGIADRMQTEQRRDPMRRIYRARGPGRHG